jgi:hypothetical protein
VQGLVNFIAAPALTAFYRQLRDVYGPTANSQAAFPVSIFSVKLACICDRGMQMHSKAERDRQHARDCAEMARLAVDPHLQRTFLELERLWLEHAEKKEERPLWRRIVGIVSVVGP